MASSNTIIKKREKIDYEKLKIIQKLVNREETTEVLEVLKGSNLNYKSLSQLKQLFSRSSIGYCLSFGKQIWENDDINLQ